MRSRFWGCVSLLCALFLPSCSDDPTDPMVAPDLESIRSVPILQAAYHQRFVGLTTTMDRDAAADSIASELDDHPAVGWAVASRHGIAIQYADGQRGGIYLGADDRPPLEARSTRERRSTGVRPGPRSALLSPFYSERTEVTEDLIAAIEDSLAAAGFQPFELVADDACTVDRFRGLEEFGIVHIFGEAWPWPHHDAIDEVYVMSGEVVDDSVSVGEVEGRLAGDVLAVYVPPLQTNVFFVSPGVVADANDFGASSSLVFLEFAYGMAGGWAEELVSNAGAAAVVGVDGRVPAERLWQWTLEFYEDLLATWRDRAPFRLGEWFQEHPTSVLDSVDADPPQTVTFDFFGEPELYLRDELRLYAIEPPIATVGSEIELVGWGFGDLGTEGEVWFGDLRVLDIASWSDDRITVTASSVADGTYPVTVRVGEEISNAVSFTASGPVIDDLRGATGITVRFEGLNTYRLEEGPLGEDPEVTRETEYRGHSVHSFFRDPEYGDITPDIEWMGDSLHVGYTFNTQGWSEISTVSGRLSENGLILRLAESRLRGNAEGMGYSSQHTSVINALDLPLSRSASNDSVLVYRLEGPRVESHLGVGYSRSRMNAAGYGWDTYYESTDWMPNHPADRPVLTVTFYLHDLE